MYPYRCTACGHKFEKIQSFSSDPRPSAPNVAARLCASSPPPDSISKVPAGTSTTTPPKAPVPATPHPAQAIPLPPSPTPLPGSKTPRPIQNPTLAKALRQARSLIQQRIFVLHPQPPPSTPHLPPPARFPLPQVRPSGVTSFRILDPPRSPSIPVKLSPKVALDRPESCFSKTLSQSCERLRTSSRTSRTHHGRHKWRMDSGKGRNRKSIQSPRRSPQVVSLISPHVS